MSSSWQCSVQIPARQGRAGQRSDVFFFASGFITSVTLTFRLFGVMRSCSGSLHLP